MCGGGRPGRYGDVTSGVGGDGTGGNAPPPRPPLEGAVANYIYIYIYSHIYSYIYIKGI